MTGKYYDATAIDAAIERHPEWAHLRVEEIADLAKIEPRDDSTTAVERARSQQKVLAERERCINVVRSVSVRHLGDYNWLFDEIVRKIQEGK